MKPRFFATPAAFRSWLEKHHDTTDELWVGFYKKASGRPSITWPEAVDVALSFGWIDSVRRSIDDISYMNRFTPRRPGSTWSAVNVGRVKELTRMGLMHPAGLKAFEKRKEEKTGIYSYEQRHDARLDPMFERKLRANREAWTFFRNQPPWYRQACTVWVMSAKKAETRNRRLAALIEHSAQGRTVPPLTRPSKSG
jgi:uncharacterized protein YdeI (YjbR/CyaY-like superfamily)